MSGGNEVEFQRTELGQLIRALGTNVQCLSAFFNLYENGFTEGALSRKVKHLIALAMMIAARNEENILNQVGEALRSGASRDEIREVVTVAVLIAGIPSLLAGMEALAFVAQFEAKQMISG